MNGGEERCGISCVSRSNSPPAFQLQKGIFDQMPRTVKLFVVGSLDLSILLRRDDHLHLRIFGFFDNLVRIGATIGQQILGIDPFDQCASLLAICSWTIRNIRSDRITMRIHGQVYFSVESPFVRPIAWLPPFAPAACG